MKKIILSNDQINEIKTLRDELVQHAELYKDFKSFTKTTASAIIIANALLNNDYKTFKRYQIKYTNHTAEKMRGIMSLSTYKRTSQICRYLSQCGGICAKCYADKSLKLYNSSLTPTVIYNTLLLKYIELDPMQIPFINERYFRFESFSDLQSSKHFKNLLNICKKNKNTIFTLWTKAGHTLINMMRDEKIKKLPSNFNLIISEFHINAKPDAEYLRGLMSCLYPAQAVTGKYTNAIKSFTVYDSETKRAASGLYQCKNKCINCLKCYKKSKTIINIAELLH